MQDFINREIYPYSEASRLLNLSVTKIRGLVNGYKYPNKPRTPAFKKQSISYNNREYLSFYDLIEIKFIKYFYQKVYPEKK